MLKDEKRWGVPQFTSCVNERLRIPVNTCITKGPEWVRTETGKTVWCYKLSIREGACSVRVPKKSDHYNSERIETVMKHRTEDGETGQAVRGQQMMKLIVLASTLS